MTERDEVIEILLDFGLDLDILYSIPDLPFNDAFAASAGTNYEHTHFDDFQPNKGDGMYRKKKDFFFLLPFALLSQCCCSLSRLKQSNSKKK